MPALPATQRTSPPSDGDADRQTAATLRLLSGPLSRINRDLFSNAELLPAPRRTDLLACMRCCRPSAHPRFLVFHRVESAGLRARRSSVQGIFCRACADATALEASAATWARGWWSPAGPFLSLHALLRNLAGGSRPRRPNVHLLLHQARALHERGQAELARPLATRARRLAATPGDLDQALRLLEALPGAPGPRPRGWPLPGRGFLLQLVALLTFLAALAGAVVVLRPAAEPAGDPAAATMALPPAAIGLRHLAVDMVKLRQAPDPAAPMVALLERFSEVQAIGQAGGGWVEVETTGLRGWLPATALADGPGAVPRRDWCAQFRGPAPANGTVLDRGAGGDRRITLRNPLDRDALVRVEGDGGNRLLSVFVAAGAETTVVGLPDGVFRIRYATGSGFSLVCHTFLAELAAYELAESVSVRPAPPQGVTGIVLAPPDQARPLDPRHFAAGPPSH